MDLRALDGELLMPLHAYRCACGVTTERLASVRTEVIPATVPCDACGAPARRTIGSPALLGRARLPKPASAAPRSWLQTNRGDRGLITAWQRELDARAPRGTLSGAPGSPRTRALPRRSPYPPPKGD